MSEAVCNELERMSYIKQGCCKERWVLIVLEVGLVYEESEEY